MRRLASLALAAAALLATPLAARADGWSWHFTIGAGTSGDGQKVTQPRAVAAFSKVRLEGSLDVRVAVGGAQNVAVTIDQNLQPLVETVVEGDTLVIRTQTMNYHGVGKVEVTTPALRGFAIEGSGDVVIDGGQGDLRLSVAGSGDLAWKGKAGKLDVQIEGSGDVTLEGSADDAGLEIAGSGDIKARALTAHSAKVEVSGSGDVELTLAGGTLSAEVNGSGDVHWHGNAQVERASVSGSGEIARR
jgi:hypothetical protein